MSQLALALAQPYERGNTRSWSKALEHQDELSIIEATKGQKFKSGPMSRERQTAWIVGTLLAIAFVALGLYLGQDDPRYPGCTGFMGIEKSGCKAEIASRRLSGLRY